MFNQSAVKNVIFDLGGVILGLDVNQTYQQFAALSGKTVDQLKVKAANAQQRLELLLLN